MLNMAAQISILVYAALVLGGGIMGFKKAKSKPSLIAALISDALLTSGFVITIIEFKPGILIADIVAFALLLVFIIRLAKTKKFMPSGLSLQSYRRVDPEKLKEIIEPLKRQFDFILLDAPAGVDRTVLSALNACEEVLIVTEPTSPAVADAFKTKMIAQRLGKKPIGIVINFVRGEKGEITDIDIIKMLELPVFGKIPDDTDVRRSFMQEKVQPILLWKPQARAAIAMRAAALKMAGLQLSEKESAAGAGGGGSGFFAKLANAFKNLFRKK